MAKLLVIGLGPLLAPGTRYLGGQCLRTWQFTRPLVEARHVVTLVTCPVDATLPERGASRVHDGVERLEYDGFAYTSFVHRDFETQRWYLRELLLREPFEAIVAVNTYAGELACALESRLPIWCDLNGWVMAEAQARAAWDGDDEAVRKSWRQERAVAWRGDRFSTVSRAQRAALIGELAGLGRLNKATAAVPLVHVVPNAAAPMHIEAGARRVAALEGDERRPPAPPDGPVPAGAPYVLWAGGFNFWTDAEAIVRALDAALERVRAAHAIVCGGAIKGYGDVVYERFERAARDAAQRDRLHLLGWVPAEEMLGWMAGATVGVNYDAASLEAEFGARNRLTNMAATALAAVTTRGTEVAADLEARGAGWFVPTGDADALADALGEALAAPEEAWRRGMQARAAALELYADALTVADVVRWAEQPAHAPDIAAKLAAAAPDERGWLDRPANALQEHEVPLPWEHLPSLRLADASLRRLRAKWPLRLWRALRGR